MKIERILAPVDFSPGSQAAVECAAWFARAHGASLDLLHVYELPPPLASIVPGSDASADLWAERSGARAHLEALVAALPAGAPLRVSLRVLAGFADQVILAEARGYDLVVMGTHGRTGLDRLVMGSVAERVVRAAPCPVLTLHLPPPET